MPSPTSSPAIGSSSRLQRHAAAIRRSACTSTRRRFPHASWRRTIRSPEPSSASLTASTSTPVAGRTHDRRPAAPSVARRPQPTVADDRSGAFSRAASRTTSARPAPCGQHREGHLCRPWSAPGSGYLAARARLTRTLRRTRCGRSGRRSGWRHRSRARPRRRSGGRTPRTWRRPRGSTDGSGARRRRTARRTRRVGAHVDRERHRQQVLVVVPVEVDVDARRGAAGAQFVGDRCRRRRRTIAERRRGRRAARSSTRPRRRRPSVSARGAAPGPRLEIPRVVLDRMVGRQLEHGRDRPVGTSSRAWRDR